MNIAENSGTDGHENTDVSFEIFQDNGIFEFMTPDRASELYQRIHNEGPLNLEWKFYGRRKPGEPQVEVGNATSSNLDDSNKSKDILDGQDDEINTQFDFDEDFGDLQQDTSVVGDSLKLKKRPEVGSEKKTNLSDIMSDIMKESHNENVA